MINNILIKSIFVSFLILVIGIIGLVIFGNQDFSNIVYFSYSLFFIASILLLLRKGEFIKTREFNLSKIGISMVIIGALFKIMRWPNADILIAIGYLIMILLYIIYLFHYKKSHWLYAVKLLFLVCFFGGKFLAIIHYPFVREVEIASLSLLIFLVTIYFLQEKITPKN